VHHLQSAFEEANSYSRYHPSKGYSWDLKERKVPEHLVLKKETQREEPSSLFQRHRVDMLLGELTRKFPVPVVVPPQKQPAPGTIIQNVQLKAEPAHRIHKLLTDCTSTVCLMWGLFFYHGSDQSCINNNCLYTLSL